MKDKIPKDLGVKIGTPREAQWTLLKKAAEQIIKNSEFEIEVQKEIIKIAKLKILIEEKTRK